MARVLSARGVWENEAVKLSAKQQDLLGAMSVYEEDGAEPMTTFDLFNCMQSCQEDDAVDDEDSSYEWFDWTREGIYATMLRLEHRGLVERVAAPKEKPRAMPVGRCFIAPQSKPASYAWQLTDTARQAVT